MADEEGLGTIMLKNRLAYKMTVAALLSAGSLGDLVSASRHDMMLNRNTLAAIVPNFRSVPKITTSYIETVVETDNNIYFSELTKHLCIFLYSFFFNMLNKVLRFYEVMEMDNYSSSLVELWCASKVCKLDSMNYCHIFGKKKNAQEHKQVYMKKRRR